MTGVQFRKLPAVPILSRLFLPFFSIRFSVSVFMLRSVILLDLNFEHDDVDDSIFILLNADIQKIRSYFHYVFLSKFRCSYVYEHMSRSSIWFQNWDAVFITITLWYNLYSAIVITSEVLLLFNVFLTILVFVLLLFHVKLKIVF